MPKPMLRTPQKTEIQTDSILSTSYKKEHKTQNIDKMQLNRLLRKKRSKKYIEMIQSLDAGGHVHNRQKVDEIIDTIINEFPEVEIEKFMLGMVSICYLGKPYEVHTLDFTGRIIEHYKSGQALPDCMEKARGIAMYGGYAFIEVYVDCCRAVSSDGSVAVIEN